MTSYRSASGFLLLAALAYSVVADASVAPDSFQVVWRQDGQTLRRALPGGAVEMRTVSGATRTAAGTVLPKDAPRDFIVQFAAPPAAPASRGALDLEAVRAPYRRFLADLAGLEAATRATDGDRAAAFRLRQRLKVSFNGVAITASRALADRLRGLPYVSGVFPDDSVRAVLDQSLTQIKADSLRAAFGLSGSGIVVSIVDTGIDYTHPALGGCLGPGCRVMGGYDFVNLDANPIDDNGHGTHVAGIVGGSGAGLPGVAPGVRFLAYKALAASGGGLQSDVIAAIDRSLDPDGNPLTPDAVDIINLSLGGSGTADDPLSQAVDRAVAAGVVCVVAAGNLGAYDRIDSPGTARSAITVGAVGTLDQIAPFSSRGPAAPDHAIKPDVVAPGVGIVSTWLSGASRPLSGTSMATPHVAGVAALLLQLHPAWTPATIKAALMSTAADLGVDPFQQGAGRIDALAAGKAGVTLQPPSLGFGLSSMGTPVWSANQTLTVHNHATGSRVVSLTTASNLPAGSSLQVFPATITLGPGEAREVVATLSLSHAPAVPIAPHAYTGALLASVEGGTLRVPFAVLRAPQLVLRTDDAGLVIIHDRAGFNHSLFVNGPGTTRLFLPAGTYDVMAALGSDSRVVREGVVVSDSQVVDLYRTNAVHAVERVCIDQGGNPIQMPVGIEHLRHIATGFGIVSFGGMPATMRFNSIGSAYAWEWHRLSYGQETTTYDFKGFQRGVTASAVVRNEPGDLRHVTLAYHPAPHVQQILPVRWVSDGPRGTPLGTGYAVTSIAMTGYLPPLTPPFTQEAYFTSTPDPDFHLESRVYEGFLYQGVPYPQGAPEVETPYLIAAPGEPVRGYLHGDSLRTAHTLDGDRLEIGAGPPTWFGRFRNGPDLLKVAPQFGETGWIFLAQQGSWRDHSQLPYALYRQGSLLETGSMTGGIERVVAPGTYTLGLTHDRYQIGGQAGRATVAATFNTLASDPDPPFMRDLSIRASAGSTHIVRFVIEDAVELGAVTLVARASGAAGWTDVPLARVGEYLEASLPEAVAGLVALRVEAADAAGNRLTYTVEPAAVIVPAADRTPPLVTVTSPAGGERWEARSARTITWNASDNLGVAGIDLAYSTDGGASFPHVIAAGLPNTGSFGWTTPDTPTGTARVRIIARDAAGNTAHDSSRTDFAIVPDSNLVINNSFESSLAGWSAYGNATLTHAAGGRTGARALQIRGSSSSIFGCDDNPNWIAVVPAKGAVYRISAWVRTPTGSRGTARIRLYEYLGSSQQGSTAYSNTATLSASWAQLTMDYVVRTAGSTLSLRVTDSPSASGETFLVDDVSIRLLSSPPPDAAPVVTGPATVTGSAGVALSFVVNASDADGPTIASFTQAGKPSAATFTVNSARTQGTFRWTPTTSNVRTAPYVVVFTASNIRFGSDTTSITVSPPADRPPVVTAPPTVSGSVGRPITFDVTASDPDGQAISRLEQSGKPPLATFTASSPSSATFSWTPAAADTSAQPYRVTFTASNALSGSATTSILVSTAPPNLCGNGTFESGASGWGTYGNAVLAVVPGGRSGNALQISGSSSFGVDDVPDWLPAPLARTAVYRISGWIKRVASASGSVKIRVYEFLGSSQQGSTAYSPTLRLTASWQRLVVDYPVRVQGSRLSIRVTNAASSGTETFLLDDMEIEPLGAGAAAEPPIFGVDEPPAAFAASFVPNPARAGGVLALTTTRAGFAQVDLFDVNGRLARRLLDEPTLEAGAHRLRVDWRDGGGGRLAAGLYFYRIRAGEGELRGRIVLLK